MRLIITAFLVTISGALPAVAHPGHLAGLAGHDHWVAGAAIGAAIALGAWAALKGRRGAKTDGSGDEAGERASESEG